MAIVFSASLMPKNCLSKNYRVPELEARISISAVIPAYNASRFIEEAIESLLDQTVRLAEIIVVDDGSTDNTYSVIATMSLKESRIKLLKNFGNLGVSISRNRGINEASSDWILFMDSDDVAEPNLIEEISDKIACLSQENCDFSWPLVYPAYRQVDVDGNLLPGTFRGKQVTFEEAFGYEIVRNLIPTSSGVTVHKASVTSVGAFDTNHSMSEDWDLWLKLSREGGLAYIDLPLIRIRRHSDNTTSNMRATEYAEREILEKYPIYLIKERIFSRGEMFGKNVADFVSILFRLDLWEEGFYELSKAIRKAECGPVFFNLGLYQIKKGNLNKAKEILLKVLEFEPYHGAALNNLAVVSMVLEDKNLAKGFLAKALDNFPGYRDAEYNLEVLNGGDEYSIEKLKVTWRELRPTLLEYSK